MAGCNDIDYVNICSRGCVLVDIADDGIVWWNASHYIRSIQEPKTQRENIFPLELKFNKLQND